MATTRTAQFTVTLSFSNEGRIDREALESNLRSAIERVVYEGAVVPDDHALLIEIDVT